MPKSDVPKGTKTIKSGMNSRTLRLSGKRLEGSRAGHVAELSGSGVMGLPPTAEL